MLDSGKPLIIAISPFGTGEAAGHTLEDDEFYFDYLVNRGRDFRFYAPRYSAERLALRRPALSGQICVLPEQAVQPTSGWAIARSVAIPAGSKVVFFGFTEKCVIAFLVANAFRSFTLALVATNNFSARRARSYGALLRVFLWLVHARLSAIAVHTDFEMLLVRRLAWPLTPRVSVKRHHLMIRQSSLAVSMHSDRRAVISFFGPSKSEKPIGPAIDLITADSDRRFLYRLFGLSAEDEAIVREQLGTRPNIETRVGLISRSEYLSAFSESSLVLLSHTRDFEGKLSGNLCDSVAYAVPFIGSSIEPHFEYLRRFGRIGFVVDMAAGEGWADRFMQEVSDSDIAVAREALDRAASDFSVASVRADLDAVI